MSWWRRRIPPGTPPDAPSVQAFVHDALVQVARGVMAAQQSLADTHARVNPQLHLTVSQVKELAGDFLISGNTRELVQIVEFDLAITARDTTKAGGGIGVVAGVLRADARGGEEESSERVSRLRFRVPISFPTQFADGSVDPSKA
jgi:hypothetical protein